MINIYSIRQIRPQRLDTQKYHRDIEAIKKETTEKLRREIEGNKNDQN